MIYEAGVITATNTDLMSTGRLNAIPYSAPLTLEFLATDADATNNWALTIQLPGGDVPIDSQIVPASNPSLAGVLDERQLLRFVFQATQGGHFTVNAALTGSASLTYRFVLA